MKTTVACLAAAVALAGLLPISAQAQEPASVRKVFVPYDDLNVSEEAGARTLLGRINAAGLKACRRDSDKGVAREAVKCRKAAVAEAVRDVRSPMLTALFEGETPATVLASR